MKLSLAIVVHCPDPAQLASTLSALAVAVAGVVPAPETQLRVIDNTPDRQRLPEPERARLLALAAVADSQWRCLDDNPGFGASHNRMLRGLDSDVHLILNPDLELAPGALQAGITYLQAHPGVALVMPRVCGADGQQQFLGKRYPSVLVLFLRAFAPHWLQARFQRRMADYEARDLQSGTQPSNTIPIAGGACLLCRTHALQAIGGFDEGYFLYFEDFDLSLRIRGQGELVFLPGMGAIHHGGHAARKGWRHVRWFVASAVRFFRAHGWRWR